MSENEIIFDVADDVATLTFNRPDSLNALAPSMVASFGDALTDVKNRAGKDIKALVITGAGRAVLCRWRREGHERTRA
jgi:enoyl-CoA hydratase/carnithine racemase